MHCVSGPSYQELWGLHRGKRAQPRGATRQDLRIAGTKRGRKDNHDSHDREHYCADSGHIKVFGQTITPELQDRIGYLPEERGLYKKMKIGEQLKFFAELKT